MEKINCCDNFIEVITPEGDLVCGSCGMVHDDVNCRIESHSPRIYENDDIRKLHHEAPIVLYNGATVFSTTISNNSADLKKVINYPKFQRLKKLNQSTIRSEYGKERVRDFVYFSNVSRICEHLKLSKKTELEAINILKRIKQQDPEFFYLKDRYILAASVVFKASRLYDTMLTQKDLINLNANKIEHAVNLKSFGINCDEEVIVNEEDYKKLMKVSSEKELHKLSLKVVSKKIRPKLLNSYIYQIAKYTEKKGINNFMFTYVEKIELKSGMKIPTKDYPTLVKIAKRIYNTAKFYKSPPTSKCLGSLYIATILKYDQKPKKFDKLNNGVIGKISELLNICIISKNDRDLMRIKYRLYPSNFRRTYFVIKKDPLEEILGKETIDDEAPYGFSTEFGNHYAYIPKEGNPYIFMKIYGDEFRIPRNDFIQSVKSIINHQCFSNQIEEAIYNFLVEGEIVDVSEKGIDLKYTHIRTNSIINKLLNSAEDRIICFERKMKKKSQLKVRGSVKIGKSTITIKTNRFKNDIVSIQRPNRNKIIRTESYDLVGLENMLREIQQRNFKIDEISSIPTRLAKPTLKLLEKLKVVERNGEEYACTYSYTEMMKCINQGFFSNVLQAVSAK